MGLPGPHVPVPKQSIHGDEEHINENNRQTNEIQPAPGGAPGRGSPIPPSPQQRHPRFITANTPQPPPRPPFLPLITYLLWGFTFCSMPAAACPALAPGLPPPPPPAAASSDVPPTLPTEQRPLRQRPSAGHEAAAPAGPRRAPSHQRRKWRRGLDGEGGPSCSPLRTEPAATPPI